MDKTNDLGGEVYGGGGGVLGIQGGFELPSEDEVQNAQGDQTRHGGGEDHLGGVGQEGDPRAAHEVDVGGIADDQRHAPGVYFLLAF